MLAPVEGLMALNLVPVKLPFVVGRCDLIIVQKSAQVK
jgi:hypothetical protein